MAAIRALAALLESAAAVSEKTEGKVGEVQPIAFRIPDAAAAAGLSRTTLYEEMDRGKLAYVKIGNRRLILRDDLVAFLVSHRRVAG
jgi:excisionase family DNA binding protein